MTAVMLVARREIATAIRARSFIVGLLITAVLVGVAVGDRFGGVTTTPELSKLPMSPVLTSTFANNKSWSAVVPELAPAKE